MQLPPSKYFFSKLQYSPSRSFCTRLHHSSTKDRHFPQQADGRPIHRPYFGLPLQGFRSKVSSTTPFSFTTHFGRLIQVPTRGKCIAYSCPGRRERRQIVGTPVRRRWLPVPQFKLLFIFRGVRLYVERELLQRFWAGAIVWMLSKGKTLGNSTCVVTSLCLLLYFLSPGKARCSPGGTMVA
ncbi:hypothetical protein CC80DRAFT_263140 [Byssothecium circinans]|uniref:Uncharacterized protein n=1 Tax=Byssothecium circinans TaxID=147558 RepID=A0A6A5UA54_9PLEO|nr:hypothetical protein CC80DRAFT_263140 [Byssothecium circinans]